MNISVVIPTYQRPDLLRRCLNALLEQTWPYHEIIVVEDGPTTLGKLSYPRLTSLSTGRRRGPAAARNLGWRRATGEVIAFTDDDTISDPDWLARGVAALKPHVLAVTGRMVVPVSQPPTDYERNEQQLEQAEFVTANLLVRRSALVCVNGFHEGYSEAWREDSDLHFKLLALAESSADVILKEPAAIVIHPVRPGHWGVSLGQQRKTRFNALLKRRHPDAYRSHIEPRPPLGYIIMVGSALFASLAYSANWRRASLVGMLLWGCFTARFLLRRLSGTSHHAAHLMEMGLTSLLIPFFSLFWRLQGAWSFRKIPPYRSLTNSIKNRREIPSSGPDNQGL